MTPVDVWKLTHRALTRAAKYCRDSTAGRASTYVERLRDFYGGKVLHRMSRH
jgi:hypothetical protein